MEHHTSQGQKFVTLLLASSILIAGLFVGGSILAKNNINGSGQQNDAVNGEAYSQQQGAQPRASVPQQAPGCGV